MSTEALGLRLLRTARRSAKRAAWRRRARTWACAKSGKTVGTRFFGVEKKATGLLGRSRFLWTAWTVEAERGSCRRLGLAAALGSRGAHFQGAEGDLRGWLRRS